MASGSLRREVLEWKGCYCHGCGWEPKDERSKSILHIHHIDGNDDNNNMDNLVPLCNHCHGCVHGRPVDRETDYIIPKDSTIDDFVQKENELMEMKNKLLSFKDKLDKRESDLSEKEREVDELKFRLQERINSLVNIVDIEVIITDTGNSYHLDTSCYSLKSSKHYYYVGVGVAVYKGYLPCGRCFERGGLDI